jgi:hypothetical protein
MADVNKALADVRSSIEAFMIAVEANVDTWTTPQAPGKWSPSQIVEHVSRAVEDFGYIAEGQPSRFPTLPFFVRPILRMLFFRKVLREEEFPKSKAVRPMDPLQGPPTPAAGVERLEDAFRTFERGSRLAAARNGKVRSGLFGSVAIEEFVRFQNIHIRHHLKQMPTPVRLNRYL